MEHLKQLKNNPAPAFKRLDETVVRPGDIILTTTSQPSSRFIRIVTRSDISHAMICVADRSVIDANLDGVHSHNTQRMFFEGKCSVHVLRAREPLTETQLTAVITYMRGHVGTQYSQEELPQSLLQLGDQWTKKQFCSRLVAQAYEAAGIRLVSNPDFCAPAHIKNSPELMLVPDATVTASEEEMSFWNERLDIPNLQIEATNALLNGARLRNGNIQTLDDIDGHLLDVPEDDQHLCSVLDQSGYLTLWHIELEKNPWQYAVHLMPVGRDDDIRAYCEGLVREATVRPHHYEVNRGRYQHYAFHTRIRYFAAMLDLYDRLSALHLQRIKTAETWLALNGTPTKAIPPLIPHTPEWLASMEVWDPPKALMTKTLIGAAGSADVCSCCGDDPARDYRLEEHVRSLGGPDTLRLCDDCLDSQRAKGDLLLPLAP